VNYELCVHKKTHFSFFSSKIAIHSEHMLKKFYRVEIKNFYHEKSKMLESVNVVI